MIYVRQMYRSLGMRLADNIKLTKLLLLYHTFNSRKFMRVNGEALQLHAVYEMLYFLLQVTQESISVLQVM